MITSLNSLGRRSTFILSLLLLGTVFAGGGDKPKRKEPPYGVIFGTAVFEDHPFYGARITIHPENAKKPRWELLSDHRGEFAQRVPPGPTDYIVSAEAEVIPTENGRPQPHKKKKLKGEAKVHIENVEIRDLNLHLTE
ncbi:MAG TPA: hypothetical protein VEW69_10940 [Alphaproteobacteria bacterium]|nr:hypothetical protein [Alphaproteobacteria bacterium]